MFMTHRLLTAVMAAYWVFFLPGFAFACSLAEPQPYQPDGRQVDLSDIDEWMQFAPGPRRDAFPRLEFGRAETSHAGWRGSSCDGLGTLTLRFLVQEGVLYEHFDVGFYFIEIPGPHPLGLFGEMPIEIQSYIPPGGEDPLGVAMFYFHWYETQSDGPREIDTQAVIIPVGPGGVIGHPTVFQIQSEPLLSRD